MLAMFGIGVQELLFLGLLCLMMVGVPVIILVVVLSANRRNRGDG